MQFRVNETRVLLANVHFLRSSGTWKGSVRLERDWPGGVIALVRGVRRDGFLRVRFLLLRWPPVATRILYGRAQYSG